jgi:hypothetical protein
MEIEECLALPTIHCHNSDQDILLPTIIVLRSETLFRKFDLEQKNISLVNVQILQLPLYLFQQHVMIM